MFSIIYPRQPDRLLLLFAFCGAMLTSFSACTPVQNVPIVLTEPVTTEPAKPSAEPLINAPRNDVVYAQTALQRLGYDIGLIDGLWGPRSAAAIRLFEEKQGLTSAEGHLSAQNRNALERLSGIARSQFNAVPPPRASDIARKLRQQEQPQDGPQLIIVDKVYAVMARPNPYSSTLSTLAPGTGVYILGTQEDNWYEIESVNRLRGFIQDN